LNRAGLAQFGILDIFRPFDYYYYYYLDIHRWLYYSTKAQKHKNMENYY